MTLHKVKRVRKAAKELARTLGHDMSKFECSEHIPYEWSSYCEKCFLYIQVNTQLVWGSALRQPCQGAKQPTV